MGTTVAVKLDPQDRADYFNKFGPLYMVPCVFVKKFINGKTYRVGDLGSEQERRVTREEVKVLDIPFAWGKKREQRANDIELRTY